MVKIHFSIFLGDYYREQQRSPTKNQSFRLWGQAELHLPGLQLHRPSQRIWAGGGPKIPLWIILACIVSHDCGDVSLRYSGIPHVAKAIHQPLTYRGLEGPLHDVGSSFSPCRLESWKRSLWYLHWPDTRRCDSFPDRKQPAACCLMINHNISEWQDAFNDSPIIWAYMSLLSFKELLSESEAVFATRNHGVYGLGFPGKQDRMPQVFYLCQLECQVSNSNQTKSFRVSKHCIHLGIWWTGILLIPGERGPEKPR